MFATCFVLHIGPRALWRHAFVTLSLRVVVELNYKQYPKNFGRVMRVINECNE